MADEQKPKAERLENLELNRETIQDLAEEAAEQAAGGMIARLTGEDTDRVCVPSIPVRASCPCNLTTVMTGV